MRYVSPPFTMIIGNVTECQDPAAVEHVTNRRMISYTDQTAISSGRLFRGTYSEATKTGSLTVSDNSFSGQWEIVLGEYRLRYGQHWTTGGSTTATATAIVAAINSLGRGWSASNVGGTSNTVTITFDQAVSIVKYTVVGRSSVASITDVTPTNGFLSDNVASGPVIEYA